MLLVFSFSTPGIGAVAGIIAAKGEVIKGVVNKPIIYDVKVLNKKW
ncbi:hypothetical protein ABFV99_26780 [Cytobacillus horneckiae]